MIFFLLFVFFITKANKLKLPPLNNQTEQIYTVTQTKSHNNKTIYAIIAVKNTNNNALSTKQQILNSKFRVLEKVVNRGIVCTVVPNSMFHKDLPVIEQKKQNFLARLATPKRCWLPL